MTEAERLIIEAACAKLPLRFALLLDAQRYAEVAELFTRNGSFARPTAPTAAIEGQANILAAFQKRPADKLSRHLISNVVIDVLGPDRAVGSCYALLYTASVNDKAEQFGLQAQPLQYVGGFEDEYALEDGVWKFARRRGSIALTV